MKLEWAQFTAKYLAVFISAIWALCTSSDYIDKQAKALGLQNLRLSKRSIGVAEHSMAPLKLGYLWGSEGNLCTVSGKYSIENSGELPIVIDTVTFKVYELPPIKEGNFADAKVFSTTLSSQIARLTPLYTEPINHLERVGIGGRLERVYEYTIKIDSDNAYAVVANASGGLATTDGRVDEIHSFGEYELEHIATFSPCKSSPNT